jgi:hypothetical protein
MFTVWKHSPEPSSLSEFEIRIDPRDEQIIMLSFASPQFGNCVVKLPARHVSFTKVGNLLHGIKCDRLLHLAE